MASNLHVIFGTGPVGCWIARSLREQNIPIRAVNRSGKRPSLMPADAEIVAADVTDLSAAKDAARGASVVYQALNPEYHQWHEFFPSLQAGALAAAKAAGARYVSVENLYMYDSSGPMTEDSPVEPRSKKGALRARMAQEVLDAHRRGDVEATTLRSSDYYGPGVLGSAMGEMVFGNLVKGKKAQISGAKDKLHSVAYIEDVGTAAAIIGTHTDAAGKVWIAPHAAPWTQGKIIEEAARILGAESRMSIITPFMMRLAGLFIAPARETVEMMYEFTEDFVVDDRRIRQAFGVRATPIETGLERTVQWYLKQAGAATV